MWTLGVASSSPFFSIDQLSRVHHFHFIHWAASTDTRTAAYHAGGWEGEGDEEEERQPGKAGPLAPPSLALVRGGRVYVCVSTRYRLCHRLARC